MLQAVPSRGKCVTDSGRLRFRKADNDDPQERAKGCFARRLACDEAAPTVLEPVMALEVVLLVVGLSFSNLYFKKK